ncbi:hypothetical protein [Actinophytocola oryzae]|uniref:Ig-like domain-containing protein n=1 Tax=Actinophytocola oryzae TaxID=502181 RepID=A0A4R7VH91_9PSEU|nr:hypothetical protein [Actinophytocola oryzae]TDV48704.1 hypothetical protein CLV71_10864 [Actinophytocola oryzae]
MRRILSLFAAVVAAVGLSLVPSGSASALGGESLLCRVVPVTGNPPFTQTCSNRTLINGTYSAGFHVFNTSGSYDSISWVVPSPYSSVGCGGFDCSIDMSSRSDQTVTVQVVLTQAGVSVTLSATAHINAVCGGRLC